MNAKTNANNPYTAKTAMEASFRFQQLQRDESLASSPSNVSLETPCSSQAGLEHLKAQRQGTESGETQPASENPTP